MSTIRRYCYDPDGFFDEEEDGEWVKYEDIKHLIEWQPIETAPKNADPVLLALETSIGWEFVTAYWDYGRYNLVQAGDYASSSDVDGTPVFWKQVNEPLKEESKCLKD